MTTKPCLHIGSNGIDCDGAPGLASVGFASKLLIGTSADLYVSWPFFQEYDDFGVAKYSSSDPPPAFSRAFQGPAAFSSQSPPHIYSERVSGVRFDYRNLWQMNVRLRKNVATMLESDLHLPLFWMTREPA